MKKSNTLVGIIPAAGKGSRLAPFPCPKELFPIGYQNIRIDGKIQSRPKVISQYLLEQIIETGASKILIVLSEGKSDIMKYYGDGSKFSSSIAYLYQEELNGMPNALNIAYDWIGDSTVLFGMPDTIIEPNTVFTSMLSYHNTVEADLTLGLFATDYPSKFGMVALDANENVVYTIDKPAESDLKYMWGCAIWSSNFTKLLNEFVNNTNDNIGENVLGDVFNLAIKRKMMVKGYVINEGKYIDIGTTDELNSALKKFHL
jgi:glucose-1-phosphate thymidylyltransferase